MRKYFSFLLVLYFILVSFGCNTEDKQEVFDVMFSVPESVEVVEQGAKLSFTILFG